MKTLFKFLILLLIYGVLYRTFSVESFSNEWLIMTICVTLTYVLGDL